MTPDLYISNLRLETLHSRVSQALDLAEDCWITYKNAPDHVRRWFNQAFFTRILVTEESIDGELTSTMQNLTQSVTHLLRW